MQDFGGCESAKKSANGLERNRMLKIANKARAVNERGQVIGEDHPRAVLSNLEVDVVLELRAEGWSFGRLAKHMGVSKSCIARICWGTRRAQYPAAFRRAREPGQGG